MRCIVSISSRRSGWICGQDAGLPTPGALPSLLLLPPPSHPSIPLPHQEPHLIHGTDLQAQFVHHCDEELGTSVCVRCHRHSPGARVGYPRSPQAWFLCRPRPRPAPTQSPSGLKNPLPPSSAVWPLGSLLHPSPQPVRSSTCPPARREAAGVLLFGYASWGYVGTGASPGCCPGRRACPPLSFPATETPARWV